MIVLKTPAHTLEACKCETQCLYHERKNYLLTNLILEAEVHFDESKTLGLAMLLTVKPLDGRQWHGYISNTLG